MNYRKLIEAALNKSKDNSLTAIALLAGLATGAAIAVIFAPRSGKDTRASLGGILENASEKMLDIVGMGKAESEAASRSMHPVDELWKKNMNVAEDLLGPEKKRKDATKIRVPSAGTLAWQENQNNGKVNPAIL